MMRYCEKCRVEVTGNTLTCPLCQRRLTKPETVEYETFPNIPTMLNKHLTFLKLSSFISIAAAIICVGINIIIPTTVFWAWFVVIGIICAWVDGLFAFKKLYNVPKNILYQVIILSLLSLVWDKITGWHNWSVDYVIPFLCVAAIVTMTVLAWLLKLKLDDYTFYIFLYAVFGIIPILFLVFNIVTVTYPSLISIGIGILSFAGLAIFKGDYILTELKNRFHL